MRLYDLIALIFIDFDYRLIDGQIKPFIRFDINSSLFFIVEFVNDAVFHKAKRF